MGENLKFHLTPAHFIPCEVPVSWTPNPEQNIYFVMGKSRQKRTSGNILDKGVLLKTEE